MHARKIMRNGVRIKGRWFWCEAMYGLFGTVFSGDPDGDTVDIYSMDGERICRATVLDLEV